jgi:signal transduction histidine kinase
VAFFVAATLGTLKGRIAVDFNLVSSRLKYEPTGSGVSTASLDARDEERLAERTRIAQELHDTLLQGLFAVSMQLHTAVEDLPADSAAKARFCSAMRTLDRVLEEGRRAVQGLRSSHERYPSLGHALAHVPADLGLPAAAEFKVVVAGRQRELTAEMREELYRIGREAIVNAYRHSRAKHIEAEIEYRCTELRIAVRDNGCGIDPQALARTGHWGLQGMRERADRIGARLRILSRTALGTEVELCLPNRVAFETREVEVTC